MSNVYMNNMKRLTFLFMVKIFVTVKGLLLKKHKAMCLTDTSWFLPFVHVRGRWGADDQCRAC